MPNHLAALPCIPPPPVCRNSGFACPPGGHKGGQLDGRAGSDCNALAEHVLVIADQVKVVRLLRALNDFVQPLQQLLAVVHLHVTVQPEVPGVPVGVVRIACTQPSAPEPLGICLMRSGDSRGCSQHSSTSVEKLCLPQRKGSRCVCSSPHVHG